ncbi:MAG: glycoside hydrolase [Actinomycetota bacterium]|nr:glycoside hydrolase [Actinomycetota bacterium]
MARYLRIVVALGALASMAGGGAVPAAHVAVESPIHTARIIAPHPGDFPGPQPFGTIGATKAGPTNKNVRVNNAAREGQLAGCNVQSETSLASYQDTVLVGFNDAQQCKDTFVSSGDPITWTGLSVSTDGGKSFKDVGPVVPNGDIVNLWGDPALAVDTTGKDAGTFYLASLADRSSGSSTVSTIGVGVSHDSGKTFKWYDAAPTSLAADFQDKEWITVDNSGGPTDGYVYLTWTDFGGTTDLHFARSTDGGRTWSKPVVLSKAGGTASRPVVGPDGELYVVWEEGAFDAPLNSPASLRDGRIVMARSTNAGESFSTPAPVAKVTVPGRSSACPTPRDVLNGDMRTWSDPSIAVDTFGSSNPRAADYNPYRGTVYVTFETHGSGADMADVFLTTLPGGRGKWTKPQNLSRDGTTTDQFLAEVAATGPGRFAATWTDRRGDAVANRLMAQWATTGSKGGAVLDKPVQLSDVDFPPPLTNPNSDVAVATCYAGDYNGLFAAPGQPAVASWGDDRDSIVVQGYQGAAIPDPNVYFSRIP